MYIYNIYAYVQVQQQAPAWFTSHASEAMDARRAEAGAGAGAGDEGGAGAGAGAGAGDEGVVMGGGWGLVGHDSSAGGEPEVSHVPRVLAAADAGAALAAPGETPRVEGAGAGAPTSQAPPEGAETPVVQGGGCKGRLGTAHRLRGELGRGLVLGGANRDGSSQGRSCRCRCRARPGGARCRG